MVILYKKKLIKIPNNKIVEIFLSNNLNILNEVIVRASKKDFSNTAT